MSDAALTVDDVNKRVSLKFKDDKGDDTAAPTGAQVAYSCDNPAVLTLAQDSADPFAADIVVVAEGRANISVTLTGALEADGTTPIPTPDPVAVTVGPGPAAQATITVG